MDLSGQVEDILQCEKGGEREGREGEKMEDGDLT